MANNCSIKVELVNRNFITIMNSSQVLLVKSILQALIKGFDFEYPYHREKVFVQLVWENLLEKLAVFLLPRQQLLRRIHHWQERTRWKVCRGCWFAGNSSCKQSRHRENYYWCGYQILIWVALLVWTVLFRATRL